MPIRHVTQGRKSLAVASKGFRLSCAARLRLAIPHQLGTPDDPENVLDDVVSHVRGDRRVSEESAVVERPGQHVEEQLDLETLANLPTRPGWLRTRRQISRGAILSTAS